MRMIGIRTWSYYEELKSGQRDHFQLEKRFRRKNGSIFLGPGDGFPGQGLRGQAAILPSA